MKKLYVVVTKISDKKRYFADFLNGKLVTVGDFSIVLGNKNSILLFGYSLAKNSFIYFRKVGDRNLSITNVMANMLRDKDIAFIDKTLLNIGFWEDKLTNNYILSKKGIPVIDSVYSAQFTVIKKYLGVPVIAKNMDLQRNQGVYVVRNENDFNKLVGDGNRYMFQKFIKIDKEYRLLVMGGKVRTVLVKDKRIYQGFQVKTPEGIPEEYLPVNSLDPQLKRLAVRASKALQLDIAGVDIAVEENTNKAYIIEVNRGPGITLDPKASPELPELKKYLKSILIN